MSKNKGVSSVVIASLIAVLALPVEAQRLDSASINPQSLPNPISPWSSDYARGVAINRAYLERLVDLRKRYLSVREIEGSSLSAAEREAAQSELDRINADWKRQIRNIDPLS
ncbi:hypothetical protein [Sphingomonas sp. NFX23]|uniref:hypothetical protein n=1 Tax=Sphingomonas sp. NFX23 TaxID=2819532 RepID=UPI003CEA8927